jgi:hypothetical protein
MGFMSPDLPDVDPDTWLTLPRATRLQVVPRHRVGVVGDHQRSAGRERIQAAHLGPEVSLQDRPQHTHQTLGLARVSLADLELVGVGAARLAHLNPS